MARRRSGATGSGPWTAVVAAVLLAAVMGVAALVALRGGRGSGRSDGRGAVAPPGDAVPAGRDDEAPPDDAATARGDGDAAARPAAPDPPASPEEAADPGAAEPEATPPRASVDPERPGWFRFVVPSIAKPETEGTAVDLSRLNPGPAGEHGFLSVKGEEVVDGRGRPVRLFGTNICDFHPMPPKDVAPPIAKRLRQLGVNFIRFHYFDWAPAPEGILNDDMQTLDPEKLDLFDWLFHQLKENGIYVDINLHVARGFKGMPEGWDWMGKCLNRLHDPYIESQERYARDLLTHVNPYTGNAYADEPAVAILEFDNENTVFSRPFETFASLPEGFAGPLGRKWNAFLRAKYRTTGRLREAWNAEPPSGPELVRGSADDPDPGEWIVESAGGAEATLAAEREPGGAPFLRWHARRSGAEWWNLQIYQRSVPVEHGRRYVATFRARAGEPRELRVCLMQQAAPWGLAGAEAIFKLTSEWRDYAASWTVENEAGIPVRLNFSSGNATGVFDISSLSLRRGAIAGLREGERLERGDVALPGGRGCPARTVDFVEFLAGLDAEYSRRMRRLVKDELGVKSLVLDTQVTYGGVTGLSREVENADVIDIHGYPDHPRNVPNEEGGGWWVANKSLVGGAFGSLELMALSRVEGMPLFATEFDLNPPNDHASESFMLLSLMAAYQGWSGFGEYSWFNFQNGYDHDRIHHYFATTGHAGQMAMIPASALVFRRGLVRRARARATVSVHRDDLVPLLVRHDQWYGPGYLWRKAGLGPELAWRTGVAVRLLPGSGPVEVADAPGAAAGVMESDTGEIVFDRREGGREHLAVNAPAARLLVGRVGGREFELGDVRMRVDAGTARDYANVALVALDEKPVAESRRLLLTTVARVENKGMRFDDAMAARGRHTVHNDFGEGPTLAEPVGIAVTLPGEGWRARALDGTGRPVRDLAMDGSTLRTRGRESVWYVIER